MIRFGIDFDGTVVLYDELFHRLAQERFQMPSSVAPAKPAIRDWFWSQSGGRDRWIELQGLVYGPHMHEAVDAPGCREFLGCCADADVPVSIVSHKTEFPVAGPRVALREQAMAWLEARAWRGIDRNRIHFESTREEKIARIVTCECTHFIDDLPEVFGEPSFPASVEQWLYAASGPLLGTERARVFTTWDAMRSELEKLVGAR